MDVVRPQPGQARDLGQERAQAHRLEDLLRDLDLALAGRAGLRRQRHPDRVADPLVEQDREAGRRGDDALVAHARLGQAEVERVVAARGEQAIDVDEVADAADLGADDDPVVARGRSPRPARPSAARDWSIASIITSRASRGSAQPGVRVHELGQDGLVERAPVDADADRLVVVDGDPDDRREVLVVALGADVARVDPVLGEERPPSPGYSTSSLWPL